MRSKLILCGILGMAVSAYAKEPKAYQTAEVLQMDSVACGTPEKASGDLLGLDSGSKKTHEVLCQEYVLQSERVIYRVRPREEKHPVLLPVGERAQFRVEKDRLMLRLEDVNNKEREYVVVSMSPRTDASSADAAPSRVNHLQ